MSRNNKSIGLRIGVEISSEDTCAFRIYNSGLRTLSDVHTIVRSRLRLGILPQGYELYMRFYNHSKELNRLNYRSLWFSLQIFQSSKCLVDR